MYHFSLLKCPQCSFPLELQFFSISSGIGPPVVHCWRCDQPFSTGRTEWLEMTLSKRLWFVVATLIYVIMLGILTGNCVDQACQLWDLNPVIVNLRYESTTFQAAAVFGGLIAIVLQCYRLAASCLRSSDPQRQTTTELFFGLQWNLQYRCLIFLLLFWGITRIRYALH